MYIHLGKDTVVTDSEIIGIFDIDYCTTDKKSRKFLSLAEKNKKIVTVSYEELPKSFIVCKKKDRENIYISPISPETLKKRAGKTEGNY